MIPKGYSSKNIYKVDRYVTKYDRVEIADNYAIDMRGVRLSTAGFILQRDFGTQQRYAGQTPTLTRGISSLVIVDGWTIFDPTTSTDYDIVACICTLVSGGGTRLRFFVYDGGWRELTRVMTCLVNGAPGLTSKTVNIDTISENGTSFTPAANEFLHAFVINTTTNPTKRSSIICSANTGSSITNVESYFGTDGLNWADNDALLVFPCGVGQSSASYDDTIGSNGSPQIRVLTQEEQRKFTAFLGRTTTVPLTRQQPLIFMKRDTQRKYFWTGASTFLSTINTSNDQDWVNEAGGGLITNFARFGTLPTIVINPSSGTQTTESQYPADSWIQFTFTVVDGATVVPGANPYGFFAITVVYDDYQESDPILLAYCGTSNRNAIGITLTPRINFAKMPKNVTALNIYDWRAGLDNSNIQLIYDKLNLVSQADYILMKTIPIQSLDPNLAGYSSTWVLTPTDANGYAVSCGFAWSTESQREGAISLLQALNHVYATSRAIRKPRFVARATREQGAVIAGDISDVTLITTCYDGYSQHEDDNWATTTPDNQAFRTRIELSGHGELLGLGSHDDQFLAFKWSELEIIDLINGVPNIIPIDFVAKKSILKTDFGTMWAGNRGIYMLPTGGGNAITTLNDDWQDLYDGTLLHSAGTGPIVTQAARSAIIAGWDPTYEEALFQIQITLDGSTQEYIVFRYAPRRQSWNVRKFLIKAGTGGQVPITHFSKKSDGTIVIGYSTNLLKYPIRTSWLDEVTSGGSGGQGYDSWVTLNIGDVYALLKSNILYCAVLDYVGASISGTGTVQLDFYANRETAAFHTVTISVDQLPYTMVLPPRGQIDSLRIKVSVPSGQLSDIKNFDVSSMSVGMTQITRVGNR